jgi:PKD repeat protein
MKKALVFLLLLILAFSACAKMLELGVEDQFDPSIIHEADTQATAYPIQGPGEYDLWVKIKNNFISAGGGRPLEVVIVMDASESFSEELQAVKNAIVPLGQAIQAKCDTIGIPNCLKLGLYVFEGQFCKPATGSRQVCDGYWYEDCQMYGKRCVRGEWQSTPTIKKEYVCDRESPCNRHWNDQTNSWEYDMCCTHHKWVEVPGEPAWTYVCLEYSDDVCIRHANVCSVPLRTEIYTYTSCSGVSAASRSGTAFQLPASFLPQDYPNDIGEIPLTNNFALLATNLGYVDQGGGVQEPWGSIMEHAMQAPELGWTAGTKKALIVITDEPDNPVERYQAAALLAKAKDFNVFGIVGVSPPGVPDNATVAANQLSHITMTAGGKVYRYTDMAQLNQALETSIGSLIGKDTFILSRDFGPVDWDNLQVPIEVDVPRDGQELRWQIHMKTRDTLNPSEFFKYRVKLKSDPTVYDDGWVEVIMQQNEAPIVDFEMIPTPPNGQAPLSVRFVNKTTDPPDDGLLLQYSWNFGDPDSGAQNTSLDRDPIHLYNSEAEYTVRLTATDALGATGWKEKTVSARQMPAITGFKVRAPLTPETEADITVTCTKTDIPLKIEFFDKDGTIIHTITTDSCEGTTSPILGPLLPTGIYLAKATILKNDLSGPDPECTNCPKTTNIVVGEKMQTVQTPEMPAILTIGIALIVMLVVNRKK